MVNEVDKIQTFNIQGLGSNFAYLIQFVESTFGRS